MSVADALREVGLTFRDEPVPTELLSDKERESILRALADFGTSERLDALDFLESMIERAERDAMLLDGREFDDARFAEAKGLIVLLRVRERVAG